MPWRENASSRDSEETVILWKTQAVGVCYMTPRQKCRMRNTLGITLVSRGNWDIQVETCSWYMVLCLWSSGQQSKES